jgi:hypothetical protein
MFQDQGKLKAQKRLSQRGILECCVMLNASEASHLQFRFFAIACLSADRLRMTRNYAFETASFV